MSAYQSMSASAAAFLDSCRSAEPPSACLECVQRRSERNSRLTKYRRSSAASAISRPAIQLDLGITTYVNGIAPTSSPNDSREFDERHNIRHIHCTIKLRTVHGLLRICDVVVA
jgi:hypothetical protein